MSQTGEEILKLEKTVFNCLMCNKTTRKYRCSKCLEFNCSYECYQEHKVNNLCLEQDSTHIQCDSLAEEAEPTQHEFKSYDTVPPDILARLTTSENLKNQLYNPHLRNLLRQLDCDPRPWNAVQNAMHEPLFVEFANECLKIIEPENAVD